MVVFLFNTVIYVFLLLCLCILIVCLCIFIVPVGTLRLPWLRFFRAFSSVVRQMPGYNSQRRGTAHILPQMFVLFYVLFVLCRSVYCLCVNTYCTTVSGWQPNCSLTNISSITPNTGFTSPLTSSRTSFFRVTYTLPHFQTQNVEGNAIPLQAWTGPDGSNRMRFPNFKTISTWRW
jgi:hypothetical protein